MAIVLAAVHSVSWQICEGMNYLVMASLSSFVIAIKNAAFALTDHLSYSLLFFFWNSKLSHWSKMA